MRLIPATLTTAAVLFSSQAAFADPLKIVTSIRPIASLVQNVAGENADVSVLVPANASPHNYALKPSDATNLQNADVVFWIDENFETFLEKAIETLPKNAVSIALAEQSGIRVLESRDFHDEHGHDDHEDEHHDDEAHHDDEHDHEEAEHHDEEHDEKHEHEDEHKHDDHADEAGHDEHEGHNHGEHDLHIWLDPINAKSMVAVIAQNLSSIDPDNAATYQENAANYSVKLDELIAQNTDSLAHAGDKKFVTFHDAYQYFEDRFGLQNAGVVTLSPDVKPGAKRLKELKEQLAHDQIACVFAEPQFDAKLVQLAVEGTDVKTAVLDPLGANLESGPEFYASLINQLSESIVGCLD